jgi:acetyl-CoA carboxylase biotin carboxyl carrier protein
MPGLTLASHAAGADTGSRYRWKRASHSAAWETSVNLDPDQIRQLIKLIESSGWDHAMLESGDLSLMLSKGPAHEASALFRSGSAKATPTVSHQDPATSDIAARAVVDDPADRAGELHPSGPETGPAADGLVFVTATSVGTFYEAPKPGAPPFVQPGDHVDPDSTVCILEVMKLMSHVEAGVEGRVREVLVGNGEMVEHGQRLVSIEPDAGAA